MIALLNYNYKIYMKYNKFMIPFILYILFQLIYYSTGTEKFVSSVTFCSAIIFCMMVWIGFSYCELQDWRTEQIVFLKTNNLNLYWVSKIVFMFSIGSIVSLIGVIWPLISNLINNSTFFDNEINIHNVFGGFIILILAAFMGALVGMIFQKRIIGGRNKSITILSLIVLISNVKIPMENDYPVTRIITWLLPPINNLTYLNGFSSPMFKILVIWSIVYILLLSIFYLIIMKKILF